MIKRSPIFYTDRRKEIEKEIISFLNKQSDFLSERTVNSTRAVGDAIENIIAENFRTIFEFYPKEIGKINDRIDYFRKVRKFWERKSE